MRGWALYRLPHTQDVKRISGEVLEMASCGELDGMSGFVMAPFAPSADAPLLVIRPDGIQAQLDYSLASHRSPLTHSDYHIDFVNFHAHLLNGDFQKLVLSRSIDVERQGDTSPMELFQRACERYPRMMVSMVYTERSGLWLAATPEILLSGNGRQWQTMALAGTMPYGDDVRWSDKDIQEQRYVATYITEQLEQFTSDFTEEGPYTVRAGHLAHLRSDFRFTLDDNQVIGRLIQALHPTPAVCGLPKHEAFRFIVQNEHHDRSYYSGFMGPLYVGGQTSLFVTLRCMRVFRQSYRLYAGGGLLKDSVEEQEWQETEAKLDTMRRLL